MIPSIIRPEWGLDWLDWDLLHVGSGDTFIDSVSLLGQAFEQIPHLLSPIPHLLGGVGMEPFHKSFRLHTIPLREDSEVGLIPCVVDHRLDISVGETNPWG